MSIENGEVFSWLDTWQTLINSSQYEAARPSFSSNVIAFGTVTGVMRGLLELENRQWRQVWHRIKDFCFDKESATIFSEPTSQLVTVCCLWQSLGRTRSAWYQRRGRVTLVLKKTDNALHCLHSHFSMEPGIPATGDNLTSESPGLLDQ